MYTLAICVLYAMAFYLCAKVILCSKMLDKWAKYIAKCIRNDII